MHDSSNKKERLERLMEEAYKTYESTTGLHLDKAVAQEKISDAAHAAAAFAGRCRGSRPRGRLGRRLRRSSRRAASSRVESQGGQSARCQ